MRIGENAGRGYDDIPNQFFIVFYQAALPIRDLDSFRQDMLSTRLGGDGGVAGGEKEGEDRSRHYGAVVVVSLVLVLCI